jgi:hypothetical protein
MLIGCSAGWMRLKKEINVGNVKMWKWRTNPLVNKKAPVKELFQLGVILFQPSHGKRI